MTRTLAALAFLAAVFLSATRLHAQEAQDPVRIAVIEFGTPSPSCPDGGAVGIHIRAEDFERALPRLKSEGIHVVIIRVNSGAPLTGPTPDPAEVRRFLEVFNTWAAHFRIVAWVIDATDAAAVAVYGIQELYFHPTGQLGAAVLSSPTLQSPDHRTQEQWLALGEKASRLARRDPVILRSMQTMEPLSATITEHDIRFHQNESGDHLIKPRDRVLTLNARDAERFGISRGTAATPEELIEIMGYRDASYTLTKSPAAAEIERRTRERCEEQPAAAP